MSNTDEYQLPPSEIPEPETQSMFDIMVEQDEDVIGFHAPWGGTPEDKDRLLQEVGSAAVQFVLARLVRFSRGGEPSGVKVMIQVGVEGEEREQLHIPQTPKLIVP